jgi:hypothetical protein
MFPDSAQPKANGATYHPPLTTVEVNEFVLERIRKMTPDEGFKSLIASGIYTPDGKLAKEYSPAAA